MRCMETAGFLIPRPCRNEASTSCPGCHKPVCGEHLTLLPDGSMLCAACAAGRSAGPHGEEHRTRDYYGYHSHHGRTGYTEQDYAAFERRGDAEGEAEPAEALEGS